MKSLDFSSLFDRHKAEVAIFSTYQFEPAYFESRLLRSATLQDARRILVLVDADQFKRQLADGPPAQFINQRYLVVPIQRPRGVFHPKLTVLLGAEGARIICGSNNLTQAGAGYNIELLNSLNASPVHNTVPNHLPLLRQCIEFLKNSAVMGERQAAEIAKEWFNDLSSEFPWTQTENGSRMSEPNIDLVHTLGDDLVRWITRKVGSTPPTMVQVISPFYDQDLALLSRFATLWPRSMFEIVAQQRSGNLPVAGLKKYSKRVRLYELTGGGSRRLHAKLMVFSWKNKSICLAGSANFTSAALEGRNVEACLSWETNHSPVSELFEGTLSRCPIAIDDFIPGSEPAPECREIETTPLRLDSAAQKSEGTVGIAYSVKLPSKFKWLSVAFQRANETKPAASVRLSRSANGLADVHCDAEVLGKPGAVRCFLKGLYEGQELTSNGVWLIRKDELTRDPATTSRVNTALEQIQTTGRGLVEYIETLASQVSQAELLHYLESLSIRYENNADFPRGPRLARPSTRDPFRSDAVPNWILNWKAQLPTLGAAILAFADRHEKTVLRRHAKNGNINGIQNFLNVLVALTRLLYVYYRRGVLDRSQVVGRLVRYLDIFTAGIDTDDDFSFGFLTTIKESLAGTPDLARRLLKEQLVGAHLRVLLLVAQTVRVNKAVPDASAPNRCLPSRVDDLARFFKQSLVASPTRKELSEILAGHAMLDEREQRQWLAAIV